MNDWMTTGGVRADYILFSQECGQSGADAAADFDRWLAAHDRQVKAEALREAAEAFDRMGDVADAADYHAWEYQAADELRERAQAAERGAEMTAHRRDGEDGGLPRRAIT